MIHLKNLDLNKNNTIKILKPVVDAKHPYNKHIMFEAEDEIIITATNNMISVRTVADGKVTVGGNVLVDFEKLSKVASLGKTIEIAQDAPALATVKCGRSKLKFPILETGYFGKFDPPDGTPWFTINLNDVIERTTFAAASPGSSNAELEAVYMQPSSKGICFAATNRHRLSEYIVDMEKDYLDVFEPMLIPAEGLRTIKSILAMTDKHEVWAEGSKLKIRFNNTFITVRLLDGTYPDYTIVFKQPAVYQFEADVKAILDALNVVSIAEGEKKQIGFAVSDGVLRIWAHDGPYQTSESLEINGECGEFKTSFNSRYLKEALEQIKGPTAEFRFPEGATSCMILDPTQLEQTQMVATMNPIAEIDD